MEEVKENKVNSKRIYQLLEKDVRLASMSKYAQFALKCLGYEFYRDETIINKWELWDMGYTDISKLLNNQYPITTKIRVKI